jgi:DNA-binding response OmpR family regulator
MPKRILVVDDDQDFLAPLCEQLQAAGFEVIAADGVGKAKELFAREKPDLAILDLMLEFLDGGFILSHHIRKADASIPIILVTAVTQKTGMDFAAATDEERSWVKADAVLDKPVRFETLRREISRLLPQPV